MCKRPTERALAAELFLIGAVTLYLELLLIRWISAEVRVFAYFKNLTLIGCFLGSGLGCLIARKRTISVGWSYGLLVALCVLVVAPLHVDPELHNRLSIVLGDFNEMPTWTWGRSEGSGLAFRALAFGGLIAITGLTVAIFVPLGVALGTGLAASSRRIAAYSSNVFGSLVGIWLFAGAAYMEYPPLVWLVSAMLFGLPLLRSGRARAGGLLATAAVGLLVGTMPIAPNTQWSPYQKLSHRAMHYTREDGTRVPMGVVVKVNQNFFQVAVDMSERFLAANPDLFPERDLAYRAYNFAYRLQPKLDRVLVIGAGTGNDVAAALRNGARHVDAVEIDPVVAALGEAVHPEKPYDDERVRLVIDDARSFFHRSPGQYDLIVFGTCDSHTLNSPLTNIRLDNYVYTVEAFRQARELLAPGGMVSLLFSVERPFIGARLRKMLEQAFGRPPIVFRGQKVRMLGATGSGPTYLIDVDGAVEQRLAAAPRAASLVARARLEQTGDPPVATDDWPYLYLESRRIPTLYLLVIGVVLGLSALTMRPLVGRLRDIDGHFFCMGAGFLLLQVQGISKLALLFGTTWAINTLVISAILSVILLANVAAALIPRRRWVIPLAYAALFASLVGVYAFPFGALLELSLVPRALASGGLTALPLFFASLIFILTFDESDGAPVALGSNLLGALVGGLCESASFIVGINALGLIALAFYACSAALTLRAGERG